MLNIFTLHVKNLEQVKNNNKKIDLYKQSKITKELQ